MARPILGLVVYLILGSILLALYNLIPWRAPASAASLADIAFSECINNTSGAFNFSCHNAGLPYGDPSTFGLPVQILIALLIHWLALSPLDALRIGYALLLGVALIGTQRLFARFTKYHWIATFCSLLYLASPIVVFEDGYGPLRAAFALFPAYVYVHIAAIEAASNVNASNAKLCFWALTLAITNTFSLFCDGYSFVMLLLVAGSLWAGWLLPRVKSLSKRDAAISVGVFTTVIVAVAAYRAYVPISTLVSMPIDFFRGQGVDAYFFAVPSDHLSVARLTGLHHNVTPNQAYSDGPSSTLVYLGYGALGCLLGSFLIMRKKGGTGALYFKWILFAGAAAFALSIGPTLKIHNFNPSPSPGFPFSSYLMPKDLGTMELHTSWIYLKVPGINFMRALYRWQLIVRLVLLISVAIVIDCFFMQRKFWAVSLISMILLAESFPAFHLIDGGGKRSYNTINNIEKSALTDLRLYIPPQTKALFLQLHPNPERNEYLASYFCASADLRCYNVGGDKGMELSARYWPAPIYELIHGISIEENSRQVLRDGLADVIIVPMFDLRLQAYYWPSKSFPKELVQKRIAKIFGDGYSVSMSRWFAFIFINKKDGRQETEEPQSPDPKFPVADVLAWGPHHLSQKASSEYVWVKVKVLPDDDLSILIDDHVLPTIKKNNDGTIAGLVREFTERDILRTEGNHTLYILDRKTKARQPIGTISTGR